MLTTTKNITTTWDSERLPSLHKVQTLWTACDRSSLCKFFGPSDLTMVSIFVIGNHHAEWVQSEKEIGTRLVSVSCVVVGGNREQRILSDDCIIWPHSESEPARLPRPWIKTVHLFPPISTYINAGCRKAIGKLLYRLQIYHQCRWEYQLCH